MTSSRTVARRVRFILGSCRAAHSAGHGTHARRLIEMVPECVSRPKRLPHFLALRHRNDGARLDRHYRPTVTLVGHRRFAMRQLVALVFTGRWLVGSTLRLTALRSLSWRLLWLALLGSLLLRFAIGDGKHLFPADRYPLSPRIQTWPGILAKFGPIAPAPLPLAKSPTPEERDHSSTGSVRRRQ